MHICLFLRCKDGTENVSSIDNLDLSTFEKKEGLVAEIVNFSLFDKDGNERYEYELEEYVRIQIVYDVYEESLKNPVLGVAVMRDDNTYICGVNTLLDGVQIPWKYGRNVFNLEYSSGARAVGGNYYFDAAIFDETATVQIQYVKNIKQFKICSGYKGEGLYIIPHVWR